MLSGAGIAIREAGQAAPPPPRNRARPPRQFGGRQTGTSDTAGKLSLQRQQQEPLRPFVHDNSARVSRADVDRSAACCAADGIAAVAGDAGGIGGQGPVDALQIMTFDLIS